MTNSGSTKKPQRRKRMDLQGHVQPNGRLTVLRRDEEKSETGRGTKKYWVCQCSCDAKTVFSAVQSDIITENTKSCGCLISDVLVKRNTKHGHAHRGEKSPEHTCWSQMNSRCLNRTGPHSHNYYGRGIIVCMGLREFPSFLKAIGTRPSADHSIDRINNDLGYNCGACEQCKENSHTVNIRWATRTVQNRNTRARRTIEYLGRHQTILEWAEELGMDRNHIRKRLNRGWSMHDAVTIPVIVGQKIQKKKASAIAEASDAE